MVLKTCKNVLTAFIMLCVIDSVIASSPYDMCSKGSDSECAKFGDNMCCAHIVYTIGQDSQDFHACTSRAAIEYSNG